MPVTWQPVGLRHGIGPSWSRHLPPIRSCLHATVFEARVGPPVPRTNCCPYSPRLPFSSFPRTLAQRVWRKLRIWLGKWSPSLVSRNWWVSLSAYTPTITVCSSRACQRPPWGSIPIMSSPRHNILTAHLPLNVACILLEVLPWKVLLSVLLTHKNALRLSLSSRSWHSYPLKIGNVITLFFYYNFTHFLNLFHPTLCLLSMFSFLLLFTTFMTLMIFQTISFTCSSFTLLHFETKTDRFLWDFEWLQLTIDFREKSLLKELIKLFQ